MPSTMAYSHQSPDTVNEQRHKPQAVQC